MHLQDSAREHVVYRVIDQCCEHHVTVKKCLVR